MANERSHEKPWQMNARTRFANDATLRRKTYAQPQPTTRGIGKSMIRREPVSAAPRRGDNAHRSNTAKRAHQSQNHLAIGQRLTLSIELGRRQAAQSGRNNTRRCRCVLFTEPGESSAQAAATTSLRRFFAHLASCTQVQTRSTDGFSISLQAE